MAYINAEQCGDDSRREDGEESAIEYHEVYLQRAYTEKLAISYPRDREAITAAKLLGMAL